MPSSPAFAGARGWGWRMGLAALLLAALSPAPISPPPALWAQAPAGDPTRGELVNDTPWTLHVYLDAAGRPDPPPLVLGPREARPLSLDVGRHRILALAYVETQFGARLAGRFDRTLHLDPRGTGWFLRFTELDFR